MQYRMLCGLLSASILSAPVFAQQNPTGLPTTPTQPGPSITTAGSIESARPQTETPLQIRFENPQIAPLANRTILPTDSLMRQIEIGSAGGERLQSGIPQVLASRRVKEFGTLSKFLRANNWKGQEAENWMQNLDLDNARYFDLYTAEIPSEFKSISWIEQANLQLPAMPLSADREPLLLQVSNSWRELFVFNQDYQALDDSNLKSLLLGKRGAVVCKEKDCITLQQGEILVDAGSDAQLVALKDAAVRMEKNSSCSIDYKPGEELRIRSLFSHDPQALKLKLRYLPTKVITLNPGEELNLNLRKGASCEYQTNKFEEPDFVSLAAHAANSEKSRRFLSRLGLRKELSRSGGSKEDLSSPLRLIAESGSLIHCRPDGKIGLIGGRFFLVSGADQIVQAKQADLYLKENSAAHVEVRNGLMRVQCFSDPKSVLLVQGKSGIPMHWGLESLILDHQASWGEALPADGVGRRAFEIHAGSGSNIVFSDFHIGSLLLQTSYLLSLRKPSNHWHHAVQERLLKTAAALQVVTAKHGSYHINKAVAGNNG